MPQLLKNQLFARLEAIIVLAETGSSEAIDVYINALKDPEQTVWVKLWAAKGITGIVQTPSGGNQVDLALPENKVTDAGKAW